MTGINHVKVIKNLKVKQMKNKHDKIERKSTQKSLDKQFERKNKRKNKIYYISGSRANLD